MNGVVSKIYILVSPDHLCAARPPPPRGAVVNLGKTAEEEGFKQSCYVLPLYHSIRSNNLRKLQRLWGEHSTVLTIREAKELCTSRLTFLLFLFSCT